jgi:hypothetical protein
MPSGMSHADLLRALMQWCPMITNDEDKEALLAGAAALEAQAQREGECERLREALDGISRLMVRSDLSTHALIEAIGRVVDAALSRAGTAKEDRRGD